MKISNEYRIEAEAHNWILIQSHKSSKVSEKTGKHETIEKKTYWGTLQQVVNRLVKDEVKGLDNLMDVVNSEKMIAELILNQISSDINTGPYRLRKHGEQL
jgi:hypothetical protein